MTEHITAEKLRDAACYSARPTILNRAADALDAKDAEILELKAARPTVRECDKREHLRSMAETYLRNHFRYTEEDHNSLYAFFLSVRFETIEECAMALEKEGDIAGAYADVVRDLAEHRKSIIP